jgi:hypothetical protein
MFAIAGVPRIRKRFKVTGDGTNIDKLSQEIILAKTGCPSPE